MNGKKALKEKKGKLREGVLPAPADQPDRTGRDRLTKNVLSSWAGHMVYIVSGFILPRLIDHNIGREGLGVWDFGWSLVSYFSFAQAGIGTSINRYVAKYHALNDADGICKTISSVLCFQLIAALIVLMLTFGTIWWIPSLFSHRLGSLVSEAQWVVFFIGAGLAIQFSLTSFSGILTGFHRWELHNALNAGMYGLTIGGMATALMFGGGLRSMGAIHLAGVTITEILRVVLAYRVYPSLKVGYRFIKKSYIRQMLMFGGKSFLKTISQVMLYQSNSLLVMGYLGPGVLAIYSRPVSLVHHAMTMVNKFALVLTPTATCLHAEGRKKELADLVIQTTRFAAYMALPMVLFLSILGGPLLVFWMGEAYRNTVILIILALGHLLAMILQPVWNIMAGMNAHGRLGLVNIIAAGCSIVLSIISLSVLEWGLLGVALSMTIPLTIFNGVYIPLYVCRKLNLSVRQYMVRVSRGPILCAIPFALALLAARMMFSHRPIVALVLGSMIGSVVLGILYWRYVMPDAMREKLYQARKTLSMVVGKMIKAET